MADPRRLPNRFFAEDTGNLMWNNYAVLQDWFQKMTIGKEKDPNFPQSPWWFTSDPARGVGLRLFRSYQPLDQQLINKFWDNIAEDAAADLESRLESGKGKRGLVDKDLPDVRSKLNQ